MVDVSSNINPLLVFMSFISGHAISSTQHSALPPARWVARGSDLLLAVSLRLSSSNRSQRRRGEWNRRQGAATWRWQQHRHGDAHPRERHMNTSLCTQRRSVSLVNRLPPTTHRTPSPELSRVDFTDREWFLVCVLFLFFGASRVFFSFIFFWMLQSSDSVYYKGTARN